MPAYTPAYLPSSLSVPILTSMVRHQTLIIYHKTPISLGEEAVTFTYFPERQTFEDAQVACINAGLTLARPTSLDLQDQLIDLLEAEDVTSNHIWIGLSDTEEEDTFKVSTEIGTLC